MERQTVLRHTDPAGETRRHHPPPDPAQGRARAEQRPQSRLQARLDPAAPEEEQERQQERRTNQPRQQTMAPLPPIDGLEFANTHVVVELAILRNLLVLGEFRLPRLL